MNTIIMIRNLEVQFSKSISTLLLSTDLRERRDGGSLPLAHCNAARRLLHWCPQFTEPTAAALS